MSCVTNTVRTCPACGRPTVSVEDIGKSFHSRGVVRCASCDAVVRPHRLFSPFFGGIAIGVIFLGAPFLALRDYSNWPYAIASAAFAAVASFMVNRYEARVGILGKDRGLPTRFLQFAGVCLGYLIGFLIVAISVMHFASSPAQV